MSDSNPTKCIITSASNKYYPSLLNMIGSFKKNYPEHPHIYVYDLGLSHHFKNEVEKFDRVSVLQVPHFISFWRSCYTWKTYILNIPLADLNFYIDAGCQILRPLDSIFDKISQNGYVFVSQGKEVLAKDITPIDYAKLFELPIQRLENEMIAAGLVGFKKDSPTIKKITDQLYRAGVAGLSLGFSKTEQWKNKGKNKNEFIRDCRFFRHDTTLLTIFVLKYIDNPIVESIDLFEGNKTGNPNQLIWNMRMNYSSLDYIDRSKLSIFSKLFLWSFFTAKKVNSLLKSK